MILQHQSASSANVQQCSLTSEAKSNSVELRELVGTSDFHAGIHVPSQTNN